MMKLGLAVAFGVAGVALGGLPTVRLGAVVRTSVPDVEPLTPGMAPGAMIPRLKMSYMLMPWTS